MTAPTPRQIARLDLLAAAGLLLGLLLIVGGIALIHIPAALIAAGIALAVTAALVMRYVARHSAAHPGGIAADSGHPPPAA